MTGRALLLLVVPVSSPLNAKTEHVACLPFFSFKERSTKEKEATARLRCKTGIYSAATQVSKDLRGETLCKNFTEISQGRQIPVG